MLSQVAKATGKYKITNVKFMYSKRELRLSGKVYLKKSICFTLFKISMPVIHLNPLEMPITEIHEGLPYFFINDAA